MPARQQICVYMCCSVANQDLELRRGKPLFLSQERYAALTAMVSSTLLVFCTNISKFAFTHLLTTCFAGNNHTLTYLILMGTCEIGLSESHPSPIFPVYHVLFKDSRSLLLSRAAWFVGVLQVAAHGLDYSSPVLSHTTRDTLF